jgi:hypothetical protein
LAPFLPRPRPLNQEEVPTANKFKMETSIPNRKISPGDRECDRLNHQHVLGRPREWAPQTNIERKAKLDETK